MFHPWKPAFLAALRSSGSPSRACAAVKVDRRWVYRVRAGDAGFAEEWDDALAGHADDLKVEALARATKGVKEVVLYRGKVVYVWAAKDGSIVPSGTEGAVQVPLMRTRRSDRLLLKLLAAASPEEFGPRRRAVATTAPESPEDRATRLETQRVRAMTDAELEERIAFLPMMTQESAQGTSAAADASVGR